MLGAWLVLVIQCQLEDTPFVHQRRFQLWDKAELHILQLLLPPPCKTFSIISEQPRPHSNLHQVLYRSHDLNKIPCCRRAFSKHSRSVEGSTFCAHTTTGEAMEQSRSLLRNSQHLKLPHGLKGLILKVKFFRLGLFRKSPHHNGTVRKIPSLSNCKVKLLAIPAAVGMVWEENSSQSGVSG